MDRLFWIENWKYFVIFAMLGFVMYWTALVIEPTYDIANDTNSIIKSIENQSNLSVEQNQRIIENQNNNSAQIQRFIGQLEASRQEQVSYLFTILNQSNVIGNQTADLILESIKDIKQLEQNITTKNDIQRAEIVLDITTALDHIGKHLDKLSAQHENITANQNKMKEMQNESGQQTGKISSFLGGPLIKNNTIPLNFGILNRTGNASVAINITE